jgi:hypothetical protein
MNRAATASESEIDRGAACDAFARALDAGETAEKALADLEAALERSGPPRPWLDAMLLRARIELGLPAVLDRGSDDLPEPLRTRYEERSVGALRKVGHRLLADGDIPTAWAYFRLIGERGPMIEALDARQTTPDTDPDEVATLIDVALYQGAHPERGFRLVLDHYGICSAITAFDHLPPDESVRGACAGHLARALHEQIAQAVRADLESRDMQNAGSYDTKSLPAMLADHPELFEADNYHTDLSHLAAIVRFSVIADDPDTLARAAELADYGSRLADRHQYPGEPPFEDLYRDHSRYLRALGGQDVDAAVSYFRAKLGAGDDPDPAATGPAQLLVRLLERAGRLDEALELAADRLAGVPDSLLICSGLPRLARRAGRLDLLAESQRRRGDAVGYASTLLSMREEGSSAGAEAEARPS